MGYCDPFFEQQIPTTKLISTFIVHLRSNDWKTKGFFPITVEESDVLYTVDETFRTVTLKKLGSFNIITSRSQACVVESNTTVIVITFSFSSQISDMCDSGLTIVPWFDQRMNYVYYKTVVPFRFNNNYVTLMMKYLSRTMSESITQW